MQILAGASQRSLPHSTVPSTLPTGKHFHSAVIDILGQQTDYRAGVGVDATLDGVIKPVLRHVGIDPDSHPLVLSGQWPLIGDPQKRDLKTKVGFAFRNQREANCGQRVPLTLQIKPGVWALTSAGAEEALSRRQQEAPAWSPAWQQNTTARWLDANEDALVEQVVALATHLDIDGVDGTRQDIEAYLRNARQDDSFLDTLSGGKAPSVLDLLVEVYSVDNSVLALPKPTPLFDPLIDVLCDLTSFQAGVGLAPSSDLTDTVLLKAGINTATHPFVTAGVWPVLGKPSLTRQVQHAMKWQADTRKGSCCGAKLATDTCPSCDKLAPLAHSSSRGFTTFVREPGKRAQWALTPAGVEYGMLRRCGGENLTPFWLAQHPEALVGLGDVIRKKNRRISNDKAMELADAFLSDLHDKDGLRDLLLAGASPTVETVRQMCVVYAEARWSVRNATTEWLATDMEKILNTIRKQLGGSLAKSRNIGEIDDLAHTYLADIMVNDTLATRLEEGRIPSKWTLASWAKLRAYSKFRDAGRDAHSRAFREATTAVERGDEDIDHDKLHAAIVEISLPVEVETISLTTNSEGRKDFMVGGSSSSSLVDVVEDLNPEESMICKMDRERGLERLEQCVKAHKKGAPDRYWGVYKYVAHDDLSTKEIAEREGVQRNRAASLTQDMRTALRDSAADSDRAIDILRYVEEEPFSTERDLHDDLGFNFTDIVRIVGALKNSGWLESAFTAAATKAENSYTITRRGGAFIREQADPELRSDLMSRLLV